MIADLLEVMPTMTVMLAAGFGCWHRFGVEGARARRETRRDALRYPQAKALVEMVMEALGIDVRGEGAIPELARATGTETRYLYRWYAGETRPSFDEAMRLLDTAGLLSQGVRERLEGAEPAQPSRERAAEPVGRGSLQRELGAIHRRLAGIERELKRTARGD
jgi:hypothetical protein